MSLALAKWALVTRLLSMWMSCLTGIPLEQCVGAGSGLNGEGATQKYSVLKQSLERYTVTVRQKM